MTAALLLTSIPLTRPKGVFKPCMWCGGASGRIEEAPAIEPALHVGRMKCEACGRQTGWVSARALRMAERLVA